MTNRRTRAQEHPLDGALPADSSLGRLLADAAAPAQEHELDGLSAALNAFCASRPTPRRSPVKTLLASLLAAKGVAAAAATASIGGLALAAATGSLPPAAQNAAHDLVRAPAASSQSADADNKSDTATQQSAPSATPSPSMIGLCRAYSAGVATSKGKALDNPAFNALTTAAGSEAAVPTYCTTLLATEVGGKPTALPTQAQIHRPSTAPSGPPATHPTGPPATHPTGPPATHPTGPPTDRP
jgi:hypothetical protein